MKKILILLLIALAVFLLWKFVISQDDEPTSNTNQSETSLDKEEVIFDEALQDLQDAKETLPTR